MMLLWVALAMAFALCFVLGGMAFRFYSMSLLGRFFTYDVAIHAGQTVIEAGPYRYIRHPSYTGGLTTLAGMGFALVNWAALLALLACAGTGYAYRMYVEEAALVAALGEPYKAHMLRATRLVSSPFFVAMTGLPDTSCRFCFGAGGFTRHFLSVKNIPHFVRDFSVSLGLGSHNRRCARVCPVGELSGISAGESGWLV
jgi:hypothetical protein